MQKVSLDRKEKAHTKNKLTTVCVKWDGTGDTGT